jgi:hypothetical protein
LSCEQYLLISRNIVTDKAVVEFTTGVLLIFDGPPSSARWPSA